MAKIQTLVGAILLAGGGTIASLPLFGVVPEVMYGAIGPTLAGGINLGIGLWCRKIAARNGPPVELTGEARALLHALALRAHVWQGGWQSGWRHGPASFEHALNGQVAAAAPSQATMAALERAAAAHNRLMDSLGNAHDERARRLRAAADAGMGEVLTQATRLAGDEAAGIARMDDTVSRMTELAERTETIVGSPEGASALRSMLDATLEELRAEDAARQELRG